MRAGRGAHARELAHKEHGFSMQEALNAAHSGWDGGTAEPTGAVGPQPARICLEMPT